MFERLREVVPPELRAVIDNELTELRAHRRRVSFLVLTMFALMTVMIFDDNESAPQAEPSVEEAPTVTAEPPVKAKDRRTEIIGLAKASEGVKLINPFAVELPKPPPEPVIVLPPPRTPPSAPIITDKISKPKPLRVMLTLKGTAISDDKKFAVVNRRVISSKENSDAQTDERTEHRLLKIGETIDGREVVDIGKDYVEFDDGDRLELPHFRSDD